MANRLAIGAASGIVWGVIAAAIWVAMFGDLLPAPGEVALPLAIGLAFVYFPFLIAAGVETLAGRSSPSLAEVVAVTVACGMALGLTLSSLVALVRRGHQK